MRERRGQRVKSEMNVVPYIDVMLVLLVIFMISAPLLNQSVEVNLPNSDNAEEIATSFPEEGARPLVITIDEKGAYFIDRADDNMVPISTDSIARITTDTLAMYPNTPVYIRGDKGVDYGAVMVMMDLLKENGAKAVGLITADDEE